MKAQFVVFAHGSTLARLGRLSFVNFTAMKSVCIPASVTVIESYCFSFNGSGALLLQEVTFEPRSQLREIQGNAFSECAELKSICLPASVESVGRASFEGSGLCQIEVERGNRHFRARGPFLLDPTETRVVSYCRIVPQCLPFDSLVMPDDFQVLDKCCFHCCWSIGELEFKPTASLHLVKHWAFHTCQNLQSVILPPGLINLGEWCFGYCEKLCSVSFLPNSQLHLIGRGAFGGCGSLESICLPSSVETLADECFWGCDKLTDFTFPPDSKLIWIGSNAFAWCALKSLAIPSLVAVIGSLCFAGCSSLSRLTFVWPSHVRDLHHLPPAPNSVFDIPDSVELLECGPFTGFRHAVRFGPESRLTEIQQCRSYAPYADAPRAVFLQYSSRRLKFYRSSLEFQV
jgi:hypothetical protein